MYFNSAKITSAAAAAALITLVAAGAPAAAKDWKRSVDNHYDAVEEAKYTPRGDHPQWGFTLDTVVSDMAWRQRTARMLREAPKPSADPVEREANQLADRPETPKFRFAF